MAGDPGHGRAGPQEAAGGVQGPHRGARSLPGLQCVYHGDVGGDKDVTFKVGLLVYS